MVVSMSGKQSEAYESNTTKTIARKQLEIGVITKSNITAKQKWKLNQLLGDEARYVFVAQ